MGTVSPLLRAVYWSLDRAALIIVAHYVAAFVHILKTYLIGTPF